MRDIIKEFSRIFLRYSPFPFIVLNRKSNLTFETGVGYRGLNFEYFLTQFKSYFPIQSSDINVASIYKIFTDNISSSKGR